MGAHWRFVLEGRLNTDVSPSDIFISVKDASRLFPFTGAKLRLTTRIDGDDYETVLVQSVFDDSIQVIRAQDGTTAQAWPAFRGRAVFIRDLVLPATDGTLALLSDVTPGPEGPEGPQGPTGEPGATGATGAQGPAGFADVTINTPSRSLNTNFTPHSTRPTLCIYTVQITCTATLTGGQSGSVELRSDTEATPTTVRGTVSNNNSVTLALAITLVNGQTGVLVYIVPPGHNVRLVSASSGSPTITLLSSIEITL